MGCMKTAIASSKRCFKCGLVKDRSLFYGHKGMADGLLGKCKECTKKDSNDRRLANIETVREYDRNRSKNKERIDYSREISKKWRKEDSRRMQCHNAVARSIRKGELLRLNCCICGSEKSVAHHESYDRPLDVVWYCQVHHKERHKKMAIEGIFP
jgi:hypothetical protein